MKVARLVLAPLIGLSCAVGAGAASAQSSVSGDQVKALALRLDGIQAEPRGVVTNAPYSADMVSTVTQVLADGTRIEQSVAGKVFRDSLGRMRREQQVLGLGGLLPGASPVAVITITDPARRSTYVIDDSARSARRQPFSPVLQWTAPVQWNVPPALVVTGDARQAALQRAMELARGATGLRTRVQELGPIFDVNGQGARQGGGGRGARSGGPAASAVPEPLGSRQIEGVMATGSRITQTIPTGQIGNDRPIVITDEVWTSPDLQVTVSSKHHDPRTGDVEYRLRNLSRNEPAANLFQVPAGYSVVDPAPPQVPGGRTGGGGRGAGPAQPPAPRTPGQ